MANIQVLDQITIDKIAAGEVIERPASVVKELVENAIDAGATAVSAEIKDGGISFIRIADNGCGIPREEVPLAFLRHSTSKIRSVDDLTHVASLGFRGEALSSIAAVAQVELITKTKDSELGTNYRVDGGVEKSMEETGARDGTTFFVRQIFYNTPARRKFLKTPMTEASHVGELMTKLALSHPEVSIQFINNDQTKLHTSGNGKLKDVIYQVFGRDIANNLIAVDGKADGIRMTGFIGKPLISRGNRNYENYYINGRYVKSSLIAKAIEDAYKDFSMQHKYPFTVLHLTIDGENLDVNVHPTKMELRFGNQQEIYQFIYTELKNALSTGALIPSVELTQSGRTMPKPPDTARKKSSSLFPQGSAHTEGRPKEENKQGTRKQESRKEQRNVREMSATEGKKEQQKVGRTSAAEGENAQRNVRGALTAEDRNEQQTKAVQMTEQTAKHTDFPEASPSEERKLDYFMQKMKERVTSYHNQMSQAEVTDTSGIHRPKEQTDRIRETVNYRKKAEQLNFFDEKMLSKESLKQYQLIGQVFDTYWLVQSGEQLYIIDQHAAHERVLYERTLHGMREREFTSQYLSPPIVLNLSMQEAEVLRTHIDNFVKIGFEIEPFGGDSYAVRAVPDNLFSIAKKELLIEMLDELADGISSSLAPDLILEKVASMSCKAAVKGKSRLSAAEADALIGELLKLDNPYHCPHGRPTIIAMTKRELEKKFKRIV